MKVARTKVMQEHINFINLQIMRGKRIGFIIGFLSGLVFVGVLRQIDSFI
jgi:hypothetical protein